MQQSNVIYMFIHHEGSIKQRRKKNKVQRRQWQTLLVLKVLHLKIGETVKCCKKAVTENISKNFYRCQFMIKNVCKTYE